MMAERRVVDSGAFSGYVCGVSCSLDRRGSSLPRLVAFFYAIAMCLPLACTTTAIGQAAAKSPSSPSPSAIPASPSPEVTPAPAAPSRFQITGIVINAVTRSPVAGAELNATPMSARRTTAAGARRSIGQGVVAVTDASGHFAIEVPSAGGWSITASAHGYHTQALDEHEGYSTAVVLTAPASVFDVIFRLPPASAIEGFVTDEAGEPVRNGQLTLSLLPPATPEDDHPRHQVRGNQRTDDRGYYKFSGLAAGNYEIRLQAQPWYASSGVGQRFGGSGFGGSGFGGSGFGGSGFGGISGGMSEDDTSSNSSGALAPDPLDVVYPTVWYPGVADFLAAAPLAVRPGEVREADFRLSPIPAFHLRIAAASENGENGRTALQGGAYLSQILPDGGETSIPIGMRTDGQGNMEFSGLAPGTYQVHRQGEFANGSASTAMVRISSNSARTVDLSQASSDAVLTVKIDPAGELPSLQISFRDLDSGHVSFAQSSRFSDVRGIRRRSSGGDGVGRASGSGQPSDHPSDHSIGLPPGRYEVSLSGIGDVHLIGIEAMGATAVGRTVTIGGGAPSLMLHVAAGRANVTGFVRLSGAADAGAMVLLVPATLGDPAGLCISRRDQSNTDGSFDLLNVLPGAYILIAVDQGWDVNWRDPATLRRFLMHGVPLELSVPGDFKATVEAQSP